MRKIMINFAIIYFILPSLKKGSQKDASGLYLPALEGFYHRRVMPNLYPDDTRAAGVCAHHIFPNQASISQRYAVKY